MLFRSLLVVLTLGFYIHRDPRFPGSLAGGVLGISGAALMLVPLLYLFVKRIPPLKRAVTPAVSMRTLLFGEYDAGRLRFGAELQDSRGWHADTKSPISTGEVNVLEPLQAYVAADFTPSWGAGSALTLQAGRMSVNMGSRRLIASDDYRNTANGVTGLRSELRWHGGWNATARI